MDQEHDEVLVDGEAASTAHVPQDAMSGAVRRFHLGVAALRLGVPIVSFFTIVAPLVASISRGDTDDVYWLLLVRPSKDVLLWGGGLRTATGEVDVLLLFLAYAPLMILMNWSFFFLGRAYGPAMARGEGPGWLQRSVSPKNFATARALLARRGPAIAVIGRVAALPPTVMAAAAGTSDIGTWRYQTADTVGAVVAFAVTVGVGLLLGEAYEAAGPWLAIGGGVLFLGLLWLITRWIRNEVDVEEAPEAATGATEA